MEKKVLELGSWALIDGKSGVWYIESTNQDSAVISGIGEVDVDSITSTLKIPNLSHQDLHPLDLIKTSDNTIYSIQSVHLSGVNCNRLSGDGGSVFIKYQNVYPISLDYDSELLRDQAGINIGGMLANLQNELRLRELHGNGAIMLSPDLRSLVLYTGTGINIKLTNFKYYHEFVKIFNKYKPF